MDWLTTAALFLAGFPALLYLANVKLFRLPRFQWQGEPPAISLLIPARNEEQGIRAALESAVASVGVTLEVIVLNDASTDSTAEIVKDFATKNSNVRLETAPPLPEGWCGKQHACWTLAGLASHETISFLDADVRLAPTALLRMHGFLKSSDAALVSGFPRQEMGTFLERLIIPLINWLLLCYLPLARMRKSTQPGLGAGCGQWFTTTKADYFRVGGHGHPLVRNSKHDGIKLPRAYRKEGLMTDLCDATDDATCRMYRSAGQVWKGFAKNAGEGMGGNVSIWIWTILLAGGHILPLVILIDWLIAEKPTDCNFWVLCVAALLSLIPRLHACRRFHQSWLEVVFHPLGIAALLGIQWYALIRRMVGKPVGWKGR
jgi:glycosyltransferase involved in cell wall biosynthesis